MEVSIWKYSYSLVIRPQHIYCFLPLPRTSTSAPRPTAAVTPTPAASTNPARPAASATAATAVTAAPAATWTSAPRIPAGVAHEGAVAILLAHSAASADSVTPTLAGMRRTSAWTWTNAPPPSLEQVISSAKTDFARISMEASGKIIKPSS